MKFAIIALALIMLITTTSAATQLFEILQSEDKKIPEKDKSLFSSLPEQKDNQESNLQDEDITFTQLKEKKSNINSGTVVKANTQSLFGALTKEAGTFKNSNSNKSNEKVSSLVNKANTEAETEVVTANEAKTENVSRKNRNASLRKKFKTKNKMSKKNSYTDLAKIKNNFIQKRIKKLYKTVSVLKDNFNNISDQLKSLEEIKEDASNDDLLSFVQTNENSVKNLEKKVEENTIKMKTKIAKENSSYHQILDKNIYSLEFLENRVNQLYNEIHTYAIDLTYNPSRESSNADVKKYLDVKGQLDVGSLDAKFANIGSIDFNSHTVNIKPDTELFFGDDSILAEDLLSTMNFVDSIQAKCGEYFNNCQIMSRAEKKKYHKKDRKIIENINKLKRDTDALVKISK